LVMMQKALDLQPWQIEDLLERRSSYLLTYSNFADIAVPVSSPEV
jgi:hypothetical protein